MHYIIEAIAAELERPRELTSQVIRHLIGTYEIELETAGPFLENQLSKLEDYEHDLILSPLFTPKLTDQAVIANRLDATSISQEEWPGLIRGLANRPTLAQLITSDRTTHAVKLREVSIERFVRRLRLDGTISKSLLTQISQAPAADQPMLKAVARRAIWGDGERIAMLVRYLQTTLSNGSYRLDDAVNLLKLVEDYQPASAAALLARIPRWQKLLEEEIRTAFDPKPFFSQTVQQMHGGDDQRQKDEARATAKRNELAFLERLQRVLQD